MKQRAAFILFCLLSSVFALAQAPVPDFKANLTTGCFPIVVKFTDLTTGSPTQWEWDLGNGTISTLQNPAATYLEPGLYRVTLKATNESGSATVVKDSFIKVYDKPETQFQVSSRDACTPAPIQFTDATVPQSGNSIVSWKWDFGDGFTSTEQNPVHKYTVPGSYTTTLTTTNDKGCSNLRTEPNYINVIKGVVPNFQNTQQTVCRPPVTINFTNTSTGPETLSYQWDFGNGQTSTDKNPTPVYTAVGTYPVTLIVQSSFGCTDTLRRPNVVNISETITDFDVPPVCLNTEVQFFDSSSDFTISNLWRFSDGSTDPSGSPYKTYTTPGTYSVTLINTYSSCKDSVTKTFEVSANPTIDFTASTSGGCQPPLPVTFNATGSSDLTYQWDFGDGQPGTSGQSASHTYNDYGNYNVTLTATTAGGCFSTVTKPAIVKVQKPVIQFDNLPLRGCIPYTISPTSTVTSVDPIVGYHWDFGDGGTSDDKAPTHTYTAVGKYKLTLTVTTASGCTESFSVDDAVRAGTKPVSDFSYDKEITCAKEAIHFTDHSTGEADEWLWDFGDGGKSSAQNPAHDFQTIGPVEVSLIAVNSGCKGDAAKKVVTIKAPIAAFSMRPTNCDDLKTYSFVNSSIIDASAPVTYSWNFGDGTTSSEKNPAPHTFPKLGRYTVSLYVTNGDCDYFISQTITLAKHIPDFDANVRSGCKPLTVVFTPSDLNDPLIKSYTWNFGDGTKVTTTGAVTHTFKDIGDYDVSLITSNQYSCSDSSVPKPKYIHVNGPVAKFSSTTNKGCIGLSTTFIDETQTDNQNQIVSWRWDFGDRTSQTYTAPPFQHTYEKVARYDVKLVVQDAAGCKDSVTYDNFVSTSAFKMEWSGTQQTCPKAPQTPKFSSISNSRNYKTLWDFGNGTTVAGSTAPGGNTSTVSYNYPDTGTYTVKMVIIDSLGCRDSLVKPYYTRVYRPHADFTANNFATYCIPFEARFTNNSTYYTNSNWNLSIGTSTQTNPVSYYTKTGTYNIKLRVTSPGGCTDDTTQVLHVFDARDGKLTYGPLDFSCRPLRVNFDAFSDMKGTFVWDFGDGTVIDTTTNSITHIYDNVGNFIPKIILREPDGCLVPITGSSPVQVAGANIKFDIDKKFFCDSGLINIFDSTTVHGPNITYNWNFGDGTVSTEPKPATHYYYKPGQFPLKLTVKTGNGCVDSLSINPGVKVSLTPAIHISGDTVICVNQFLQSGGVFDKRDSTFVRWAWQFPNGTSSALQTPPDQLFRTAGRFTMSAVATNTDGCADTATKNVLVHPLPTSTLPSTYTIQPGYPATITGEYSSNVVSYNWKPATGLSCTDCPNPVASPKFNTKYVVQYVDSNGCRNADVVQVIVLCKNANVFIPNTFSPNGDGHNDVFYVRGRGLDRVKSLRIFDRWGEVVFEKKDFPVNDASVGWDGRYKGGKPMADVYVYQVEVFCENSEVIRFDGNVALIQ